MASPQPEIPIFEPHPGDYDLDATLIPNKGVLFGDPLAELALSRQTADQYWAGEYAKTNQLEATIPHPKTYEEYVATGKQTLQAAVENEKILGLEATADLYQEAGVQFLGAIGSRPFVEGTTDIRDADPILLIEYATCLTKQVQAGDVGQYTDPHSRHIDRGDHLRRIAKETFHAAWDQIMSDPELDDDLLLPAALVTADGLESNYERPESKIVLAQARQALHEHDTQPLLVKRIDNYVFLPDKERTFSRHEVAAEALLDLTTDSHEVVQML